MSDLLWLKDYVPVAGAAGAIVAAVLSWMALRASVRQKFVLDGMAKRQEIALQEVSKQQVKEIEELRAAIAAIQQMRDQIHRLLANAGVKDALSSSSLLEDLNQATQAIATAYQTLLGRHSKETILQLHEVKSTAAEICDSVRGAIGKQRYVPQFTTPVVKELEDTRAQMAECQDALRDRVQAVMLEITRQRGQ